MLQVKGLAVDGKKTQAARHNAGKAHGYFSLTVDMIAVP